MEQPLADVSLVGTLIPEAYAQTGAQSLTRFSKRVRALLSSRQLPARGWSDADLRLLMLQLAQMDSNNFPEAAGVGEREGRVVAPLVAERSFGFAHGMGRSGDLVGPQPKAAGSSLVVALTNAFVVQLIRAAGHADVQQAVVVPVATGMALFMCLAALKRERPGASLVLWPRCDQNSAIKAVALAGLTLVPVPGVCDGDELVTDMASVAAAMVEHGAERVCCVLSTTSCFAPRACDNIEALARLCAQHQVPHLVNHAYGLQCATSTKLVARASRVGRVDAFVSSTDKNFLVPVGGAVIAGRLGPLASSLYAGRASSAPVVDVFLTALSLGLDGWRALLSAREALFDRVREALAAGPIAGMRLLHAPGNRISLALAFEESHDEADPKMVGSMLFSRGITGHRVCVHSDAVTTSGGHPFVNWGQHCPHYKPARAYLTLAVALGVTGEDVDKAVATIVKVLAERAKKAAKKKAAEENASH